MARVEINTAGHQIVIDADVALTTAARTAMRLWKQTRDPRIDRAYGTAGFTAERAAPDYCPSDGDLRR